MIHSLRRMRTSSRRNPTKSSSDRRVSHIFTIDFTDTFHPQLTRVGEIRIIHTL